MIPCFNTLDVKVQLPYLLFVWLYAECFNTLDVKVQLFVYLGNIHLFVRFNTLDVKVQHYTDHDALEVVREFQYIRC